MASVPPLKSIRIDLMRLRGHATVLSKSQLDWAIAYTLALWSKLEVFLRHGSMEIDKNLIENAFRPTAVETKNRLFVGERIPLNAMLWLILWSKAESVTA